VVYHLDGSIEQQKERAKAKLEKLPHSKHLLIKKSVEIME